MNITIYKKLC